MSESGSFEFDSVPIVEVTSDNAKELEPAIRVAIANSDFVSIDCVSSFKTCSERLQGLIIAIRQNKYELQLCIVTSLL